MSLANGKGELSYHGDKEMHRKAGVKKVKGFLSSLKAYSEIIVAETMEFAC